MEHSLIPRMKAKEFVEMLLIAEGSKESQDWRGQEGDRKQKTDKEEDRSKDSSCEKTDTKGANSEKLSNP